MSAPATNPAVELGRYRAGDTERLVRGQRVDGVVRLTGIPASGQGRRYLIERGLTSRVELEALVRDYLDQAARWNAVPVLTAWLDTTQEA